MSKPRLKPKAKRAPRKAKALSINTLTDTAFRDVAEEIIFARSKFPSTVDMYIALAEEVGELAQALLHHKHGKKTATQVYQEAVQVACMAIRLATEGDASMPYSMLKCAEEVRT